MTLRAFYNDMVYEDQESILVLDDLEVRGKIADLHIMLSDEVLSSRVQHIEAENDTLKVWATLLNKEGNEQ